MFRSALEVVLEHEGGARFTDLKADPGGATKWGVSLRLLRAQGVDIDHDGDVDADDVRALTFEDAAGIYERLFWKPGGFERFDSAVATKLFDTAVNVGIPRAARLAQAAVNRLGATLTVDGCLGAASVVAINGAPAAAFLVAFCEEQAAFYQDLIKRKPDLAVFRNGWLSRAAWLPDLPLESAPVPEPTLVPFGVSM